MLRKKTKVNRNYRKAASIFSWGEPGRNAFGPEVNRGFGPAEEGKLDYNNLNSCLANSFDHPFISPVVCNQSVDAGYIGNHGKASAAKLACISDHSHFSRDSNHQGVELSFQHIGCKQSCLRVKSVYA